MGKRKLMTIVDLYNYCLKNNFHHFNSSHTDVEIYVQLPATFESEESFDKDKEGLTPFVAKAYHDHINLNKSEIKPETLKSTLPSAMLRPILASIVTDENTGEKDFGSHDFVIETDEDGNEVTRYIEQPVGVIFGNNIIEYDEEDGVNRAILHGYLFDEYCQDAVDIMNRRKTVDCSVELSIREMSFNATDKVLTLDDFYVSGLTLLGASIKPGMKGSKVTIEDFCKKHNSVFSHDEKLIETLEKLNTTLSNFNINHAEESANETYEEGGNTKVNNEKFLELLEKYNKTEDDIDFEVEGLSDEELEAKFEEVFGDESEEEPTSTEGDDDEGAGITDTNACGTKKKKKKCEEESKEGEETPDEPEEPVANEGNDDDDENLKENNACGTKKKKKKCSRTYEFELSHDDIRYALYNLLTPYEESDNDYYWIVAVYDDYFVYQGYSGNYFGQKYSVEEDNVAFDGERYELYVEFLTKSEKTELEDMRSNYSSISDQLAKYQEAETKAQKEEILTDKAYSRFMEEDAFKAIVEEADSLSVEELRTKCELTFAKLVKEHGNFAMTEEPETKRKNKIGINTNFKASSDSEPYGDYFKSLEV